MRALWLEWASIILRPSAGKPQQKRADLLPISKHFHVADDISESPSCISVTRGCKTNHTFLYCSECEKYLSYDHS